MGISFDAEFFGEHFAYLNFSFKPTDVLKNRDFLMYPKSVHLWERGVHVRGHISTTAGNLEKL